MATVRSLRGFAAITLFMQIFFGIIYDFEEGYSPIVTFVDFNGLLAAVFLCMLLLVGTSTDTQDLGFSPYTSRSTPFQDSC